MWARRPNRGIRLLPLHAAVAALAAVPAWAAEDANEIVRRFIDAQSENWKRASQYTYVEQTGFFGFDKNGQPKKKLSETHEIVFVEGLAYRRLIARNERPLDPKEQAKEEKRMRRTAEERRKQRRSGLFRKKIILGSDKDLLTLFDSAVLGEEEIRGRMAWLIECTPKAGRAPVGAREKQVLSFRRRLWIDKSEYLPLKSLHTVIGQGAGMTPGTTITWEFEKINGDAWLPASGIIDGRLRFVRFIQPAVRTEYRNSNFQRFDVQSTITTDPPP